MTKAWWLGFPRFRCPHCDGVIEGVKFVGKFKLPRVRRESGEGIGGLGGQKLGQLNAKGPDRPRRPAAAKRTRIPRRDVERGVTGP